MRQVRCQNILLGLFACFGCLTLAAWAQEHTSTLGREIAIARHLQDGEEFEVSLPNLIKFGEKLFTARFFTPKDFEEGFRD